MALGWAGAAMREAAKGFRRLKVHKRLPLLKEALKERNANVSRSNEHLAQTAWAA
jgi:PhoPQ-activated pathogenicity-related protein